MMITCFLLAGQIWFTDGEAAFPMDDIRGATISDNRLVINTLTGGGPVGDPLPQGTSVEDALSDLIASCDTTAG
mgnify:CR=1 FL=1